MPMIQDSQRQFFDELQDCVTKLDLLGLGKGKPLAAALDANRPTRRIGACVNTTYLIILSWKG